ncbi:MAG: aldehyde dehydrogenase family protein, partial [Solirubrobacteraceae bacterium]
MAVEVVDVRDDGLLIGGSWRPAQESFERRNPARPGELVGRTAAGTPQDVADAYAAAAKAAPGWRRMLAPARGGILVRAAELIDQRV